MTQQAEIQSEEQVLDFGAIFDRYMEKNVKVWAHDRSQTVGASEIFGCLRAAWFEKRGAEFGYVPDPGFVFNWGATERGNIIENNYVVPGLHAGLPPEWKLEMGGDDQQTLVMGRASATPDGIIRGLDPNRPLRIKGGKQNILIPPLGTDCIIIEIKSIDPRAVLAEERTKHHGQTQVQLGLINELTAFKPTHSVILYVNASFLNDFTPFVVEFKPEIYAMAKDRAQSVWAVNDPMMIIPEGKFDDACKYCKFQHACTKAVADAIPSPKNELDADDPINEELEATINAFVEAREALAALEKQKEQLAERVKECLLDADVRRASGHGWKVSWASVKGKSYVDFEAMEKDGIDLTPYRKTGPGHDRLTVTKKAPENVIE